MSGSFPIVPSADARLDIVIEPNNIVRFNYPAINGDLPLFSQIYAFFAGIEKPWTYDCMFNMLPFQGHILMDELGEFAQKWYMLTGGKDNGRKVASISVDPLTIERLPIYKDLFPSRIFRICTTIEEGYAFLNGAK